MTCQEWRKNAERFIQKYINCEKNSPSDSLNQVYARGPFAGGSVRSVLAHAKELLKTNGHTAESTEDGLIKTDQQLQELRDVNTGLVMTVVGLRSALREYGQHVVLCPQSLPPDERPCDCGLDDEIRS